MQAYIETLENSLGFQLEDAAKEWPRIFPLEKFEELRESLNRFYSSYSAPDYTSSFDPSEMTVIDNTFYAHYDNVYTNGFLRQIGRTYWPGNERWLANARNNTNAFSSPWQGTAHYSPLSKDILNPLLFAHRLIIPDPVMKELEQKYHLAVPFIDGTFLTESSELFGAILHIARLKELIKKEIVIVCHAPSSPLGILASGLPSHARERQVLRDPNYDELHELSEHIFEDNKKFFLTGERWNRMMPVYMSADDETIYLPPNADHEERYRNRVCDRLTIELVMAYAFPNATQSVPSRYARQAFDDFAVKAARSLAAYNSRGMSGDIHIDTYDSGLETTFADSFLIDVESIQDVDIIAMRRQSDYFDGFRSVLSECAREITAATHDNVLSAREMHRIFSERFAAFRLTAEKQEDRTTLASLADFSKRLLLGFVVGGVTASVTGASLDPALIAGGLGGLLAAYDFKRPTSRRSFPRLIQAHTAAVLPRDKNDE